MINDFEDIPIGQQDGFVFHDLAGRFYVLTGAANGMGRELAYGLSRQKCNLFLVDRDEDGLRSTAEGIDSAGLTGENRVISHLCDLADPDERRSLCEAVSRLCPVIDGIVHNAAIDPRSSLENTGLDFFRRVMATNVEPALEITRDLLPMLRRSRAARVVMIGSVTLEIGTAYLSSYVASKGALVGLTRSLSHELGADGITVNCISPGAIAVEKEQARFEQGRDVVGEIDVVEWQAVRRPLLPRDILGPLCLLLSEAGGGISGQTLSVDGGLTHPMAAASLQAIFENQAQPVPS